jgi:hypothetical protein
MPVIERTVRPRRNRVSVEVPREFSAYTCRVIVIPIEEVMQQLRSDEERVRGSIRVGLMRNEIRLPEDFEQEFESLDGQVAAMFEGMVS